MSRTTNSERLLYILDWWLVLDGCSCSGHWQNIFKKLNSWRICSLILSCMFEYEPWGSTNQIPCHLLLRETVSCLSCVSPCCFFFHFLSSFSRRSQNDVGEWGVTLALSAMLWLSTDFKECKGSEVKLSPVYVIVSDTRLHAGKASKREGHFQTSRFCGCEKQMWRHKGVLH